MTKLVAASTPGVVERDRAIRLLVTWDVLVRCLCRELADRPGPVIAGQRAWMAFELLQNWKADMGVNSGLRPDSFPADCSALLEQVRAGEDVCAEFARLLSADNMTDVESDFSFIDRALANYWARYEKPAFPPPLD